MRATQVLSALNYSGTFYNLVVMLEHKEAKRHAISKHDFLTHVFDMVVVMSFLYRCLGAVHLSSQLFKGNHVRSPSSLAPSFC